MRWAVYLGYAVALGGLVSVGYGLWQIYAQDHLIKTAVPVNAIVTGTHVRKERQKHFIRWAPVVDYEYHVAAKKIASSTVTPTESVGSKAWAEQITGQYPVGAIIIARVDPGNPESAFLVPKYGPMPYLAVLVSFVIAAMGLGVVLEQKWASSAPSQSQAGIAGVRLRAKRHPMTLTRIRGLLGAAGMVVGGPVMLHYAVVSSSPRDPLFLMLAAAYGIAVAVTIGWAGLGYWRCGQFGTPRVTIRDPTPVTGDTIDCAVTVPIGFNGYLRNLSLRMICESRDQRWFDISGQDRDQVLLRQESELVKPRAVNDGEEVNGRASFLLPAMMPPTTPPSSKKRTHTIWTLQLKVEANLFRSLESEYILNVAAPK